MKADVLEWVVLVALASSGCDRNEPGTDASIAAMTDAEPSAPEPDAAIECLAVSGTTDDPSALRIRSSLGFLSSVPGGPADRPQLSATVSNHGPRTFADRLDVVFEVRSGDVFVVPLDEEATRRYVRTIDPIEGCRGWTSSVDVEWRSGFEAAIATIVTTGDPATPIDEVVTDLVRTPEGVRVRPRP